MIYKVTHKSAQLIRLMQDTVELKVMVLLINATSGNCPINLLNGTKHHNYHYSNTVTGLNWFNG